ncbi:hypothetical protein [Burkholderia anthina]|uniref:hypothetical protein n=1 Tax=Burkholderia anthina TaxID=179879 RepID=UPI001AA01C09|nr:hypothetical protein [Burkholderia anthina]QTD91283.1 hypothetical protein J4G50_07895 [Burkholderia anthina]
MKIFKPRAPTGAVSFAVAPSPELIRKRDEYASIPVAVAIARVQAELAKLRTTVRYVEEANRGEGGKYLAMTGDDVTKHYEAYQIARAQPGQRQQTADAARTEIDRILKEISV